MNNANRLGETAGNLTGSRGKPLPRVPLCRLMQLGEIDEYDPREGAILAIKFYIINLVFAIGLPISHHVRRHIGFDMRASKDGTRRNYVA
jgi:hypothetical protein